MNFSMNSFLLLLATFLTFSSLIIPALSEGSSEETGKRQASHNIMRFGRTAAGHNIMRFGRAGHNIMHFGKRGGGGDEPQYYNGPYEPNEPFSDQDSSVDIPLASLYVQSPQSSFPIKPQPVTNFLPSNYSPEILPANYPQITLNQGNLSPFSRVINVPEKRNLPSLSAMLFDPPDASSSLARKVLVPHLFLSSFYPTRRIPLYNKKADRERDNVFMHFG